MSSLFEDLQEGLNQAIAYERGKGKAKVKTLMIMPVKKYTNEEIRAIRNKSGMTQTVFANYMGVSKKTVEAWEAGTNHPSGAASRLLSMIEQDKELIIKFPFVTNALAK